MSYHGMGAAITTTTTIDVPAIDLQRSLLRGGFPVGTPDGIFGVRSESALHQALIFLMQPDTFVVTPDRRTVKLDPNALAAINKARSADASTTPLPTDLRPPAPSATPPSDTTTPPADAGTTGGMDWTPWLIGGGVALAGAGAWLMFSKKTPMKSRRYTVKNARRRATKRRKTRRTRRARASSKRRRARSTTARATRRRVHRNNGGYRVVGPRGTVGSGRMSMADAITALRRLGGARAGYRIEGGGIRRNPGARDVVLDGYVYEYTGPRGRVFTSDDDDWETVMVAHRHGSVVGSRNIDGSRMAIVKGDNGKTYAILWNMMRNRRRAA